MWGTLDDWLTSVAFVWDNVGSSWREKNWSLDIQKNYWEKERNSSEPLHLGKATSLILIMHIWGGDDQQVIEKCQTESYNCHLCPTRWQSLQFLWAYAMCQALLHKLSLIFPVVQQGELYYTFYKQRNWGLCERSCQRPFSCWVKSELLFVHSFSHFMLPPKSAQEEKLQENIVDSVKATGQRDLGLRRGLLIALKVTWIMLKEPFQDCSGVWSWVTCRVIWVHRENILV